MQDTGRQPVNPGEHPMARSRPRPRAKQTGPARLVAFNKPMNVLSQFTDDGKWPGLGRHLDLPGLYPAGRLDRDSEGLMVLTDDGKLQARIASPKFKRPKTYLVQVEGDPTEAHLAQLALPVVRASKHFQSKAGPLP